MNDSEIDIRILRYILAIADHRSFTRAAQALNIAQPSLSQQILRLEKSLGAPMFFRHSGGVTPTSLGATLLERGRAIVVLHDDLIRELKEDHDHRAGTLTLGSPSITGGHLLPPWLARYRAQFPDVKVKLIEQSPEQLEELTDRGIIDLCLLALPLHRAQLETYPVLTEGIVLVLPTVPTSWMPPSWCLWYLQAEVPMRAEPEPVALAVMSESPFILLKEGYGFRQTVLSLCATSGFQPNVVFETANIETAQALAAHGHGVTLVPEMVMVKDAPGMPRYLRLQEAPTRTLVLARRQDRYLSQAARDFIGLIPGSPIVRAPKASAPG